MLFAGRKRQHETALARRVHRLAAEAARHLADIFLLAREQAQIRPAKLQADADGLALAHDDVRAHMPRRPIGRATCRAKVCLCVYIWVVPVYLKTIHYRTVLHSRHYLT